mmetsp:Transcript_4310/g.10058  ORF Transcript_4310/g.10058 Transcript_4310/m.10058 type:complete len:98 (-) Transcript_4310:38-331(-)
MRCKLEAPATCKLVCLFPSQSVSQIRYHQQTQESITSKYHNDTRPHEHHPEECQSLCLPKSIWSTMLSHFMIPSVGFDMVDSFNEKLYQSVIRVFQM